MAVFAEDGAFYRAEVVEINKSLGTIVRYIDYGNRAIVDPKQMYRVEKRFMELPKQAVNCSLKNIVPANGMSWSNANREELVKLFDIDNLECTFHEYDGTKYITSLNKAGIDVAGQLVEKSVASFAVSSSVISKTAGKNTRLSKFSKF